MLKQIGNDHKNAFHFQGSIHAGIPVIIFGICSATAGLFSLMLPETLNKKLPESVAEIERQGRQRKGQ